MLAVGGFHRHVTKKLCRVPVSLSAGNWQFFFTVGLFVNANAAVP
jgi:hypothetical protein